MVKRALCVGINDYSARAGFATLNGAKPDAETWAQTLVDAFLFQQSDIVTLTDGAATKQAVLDSLTTALNQSTAGDVVCFFFSGHGGRSQSADGSTWCESICCADDGGNITNDTFDSLANALEPSTVNFTLVLDSCHSGGVFDAANTGAKTVSWTKDMADLFASSVKVLVPHVVLSDVSKMQGNVQVTKKDDGSLSMTIDDSLNFADTAKATLLAACRYDQVSYDGAQHGVFTQALLDTINQSNYQSNHQDLLSKVQTAVAASQPSQMPQLRGRPIRLEENFLAGWNYSV